MCGTHRELYETRIPHYDVCKRGTHRELYETRIPHFPPSLKNKEPSIIRRALDLTLDTAKCQSAVYEGYIDSVSDPLVLKCLIPHQAGRYRLAVGPAMAAENVGSWLLSVPIRIEYAKPHFPVAVGLWQNTGSRCGNLDVHLLWIQFRIKLPCFCGCGSLFVGFTW